MMKQQVPISRTANFPVIYYHHSYYHNNYQKSIVDTTTMNIYDDDNTEKMKIDINVQEEDC
jgi:hypothetical protein